MNTIRTLGILLFPGFEPLDVFGPLEMFGQLPENIKIVLIAEQPDSVTSIIGAQVKADHSLINAPKLDILMVPGGMGTRKEVFNQTLIAWIATCSASTELTLSVCTGAALLAKAGVLDGYKATSNKLAFDWVCEQGQQVEWIRKARWVEDGKMITSSGVSAGMDMSLFVIAKLFGEEVRNDVARRTEYLGTEDADLDPFA